MLKNYYKDIIDNPERWYSLENYEDEIWKSLKDFEEEFQCSNYGRIKRNARSWRRGRQGCQIKSIPEGIVKQRILKQGYVKVNLCKKGIKKSYSVQRLVALTFIPNKKKEANNVNHKDGNKINNMVSNLEWVTPSENTLHSLYVLDNIKKHRARYNNFSKEEIQDIKNKKEQGILQKEIAKIYGVSLSVINLIITNRTYQDYTNKKYKEQ